MLGLNILQASKTKSHKLFPQIACGLEHYKTFNKNKASVNGGVVSDGDVINRSGLVGRFLNPLQNSSFLKSIIHVVLMKLAKP